MDKRQRSYSLTVQGINGDFIKILPPLTIEFDVRRNDLSSINDASIRIYNLSEKNRNQIRKNATEGNLLRTVVLAAGYGTNLPVILKGNIRQAWSVREGNNFITQIECQDGGYADINAQTNVSFVAGTTYLSIINTLVDSLAVYGISKGQIGSFPGSLKKGAALSGATLDLLQELTGGNTFIDNGVLNCLGKNEVIRSDTLLINSASGLLGTPVRDPIFYRFDMIFEPRLFVGKEVELQSITDSNFNGTCKVIAIQHKGMISESVCGEAITSVGLDPTIGRKVAV